VLADAGRDAAIRRTPAPDPWGDWGFEVVNSTIRFPPDKPLPSALVERLVKARLAAARAPSKGKRKKR
jgi:uncharacterized protein YdhG (YjbR/CyaY superfamily)